MTSILSARNLTIGYRRTRGASSAVARGLSLDLRRGEIVCLLGPNGAGKSTLMRTLAGMQPPLEGCVEIEGQNLHALPPSELARSLSIVLTERIDVGNLSAYELVSLGRHPYTDWSGKLGDADHRAVRRAMQAVGAETLSARPVNELSDGERQKVMIARALAQEPTIMLLDEPTAFLDLPRRVEMVTMLRDLAHATGCAILLSTHDLDLALSNADCVWLLPMEGAVHVGTPEELVLNGAFAAAFRSEGLVFDRGQGTFKVRRRLRGSIGLSGTGETASWTGRALERIGFEVIPHARELPVQVQVVACERGIKWVISTPTERSEYATLGDLLRHFTN